jgi:microcin C transport system permease protein
MVLLSLGAELLSNDRPLLVRYQGKLYVPVMQDYPETAFGGDFQTSTDYLDPLHPRAAGATRQLGCVRPQPLRPQDPELLCQGTQPVCAQPGQLAGAPTTGAATCWRS